MAELLKELNWRKHTVGLVVFTAALVFFVYAYVNYDGIVRDNNNTHQKLQRQKQTNRNAMEQLEVFRGFIPQYQSLKYGGLVGNKRRLDWIESLKVVGDKFLVPNIDFVLQSSELASPTKEHYFHDQLKLHTTTMILNLSIFHEGDWYNAMRYLHENANGIFSVEKCDVVNKSRGLEGGKGFEANCELKWYTLEDLSVKWEGDEDDGGV